MAKYIQKGDSVNYVNAGNREIEAGGVIDFGSRIAIAGGDIAPGETGTAVLDGVWELPKGSVAIALGDAVYYDAIGGKINLTNTGIPAGIAVEAADADATTVKVKI